MLWPMWASKGGPGTIKIGFSSGKFCCSNPIYKSNLLAKSYGYKSSVAPGICLLGRALQKVVDEYFDIRGRLKCFGEDTDFEKNPPF